ncbi:hypothetical protein [Oceanibium sediminis]|uniref:hypothetical protein n=1 Tax=Oceanibium sediminis TaxID=2026339 RepID=UPI000DD4E952|nr:hypothetical protein [Oceanibium sediminis]
MTRAEASRIRTRADGSIDTAHYIARSRLLRSKAAHASRRSLWRWICGAARPARQNPHPLTES